MAGPIAPTQPKCYSVLLLYLLFVTTQGDGTREGSGKCSCDSGYEGELCDECADLFFEEAGEDSKPKCTGKSMKVGM